MVRIIAILFSFILFIGCATINVEPIKIPKAEFEKTEPFILNETIEKPPKPEYILLDSNLDITEDKGAASYVAFTPDQFARIIALSKAFDTQEEVIIGLSNLVNVRIEQVNSLKELIGTQEVLSEYLTQLYVNEQRLRQAESQVSTFRDILNKIVIFLQTGAIVALAL